MPRSATTPLPRAPTRSRAARTSARRASTSRWPRASSIARRGWRRRCDAASPTPAASYLVGRAELLLERPDSATDALRTAADGDPHNPIVLHGARARRGAAHRDDRALEAYRRALADNANHIATIIDRALLQVDRAHSIATRRAARSKASSASSSSTRRPGSWRARISGSPSSSCKRAMWRRRGAIWRPPAPSGATATRSCPRSWRRRSPTPTSSTPPSVRPARAVGRSHDAAAGARRSGAAARAAAQGARGHRRGGRRRGPSSLVMRAQASLMLGRKESARLDAEQALRVQPRRRVGPRCSLGRVDIADGHPEQAQRALAARSSATTQKTPRSPRRSAPCSRREGARSRALVVHRGAQARSARRRGAACSWRGSITTSGNLDAARAELKHAARRSTRPTCRRGAKWRSWRSIRATPWRRATSSTRSSPATTTSTSRR